MSDGPKSSLAFRLYQRVRPCWTSLAGLLLLSLLSPPVALLTPLPLKVAVDNVIGARPLPPFLDSLLPAAIPRSDTTLLVLAAVLVVVVAGLGQIREFGTALLSVHAGEKLMRSFRAELFRHAQRLSLSYHERRGTADSTYRIQYDAACLQYIAVDGIVPFFTSLVTIGAMLYVTARINWQLALVGLAIAPAILVLSGNCRHRLRRQSRHLKKLESSALGVVQEVLGSARVVKAFAQEERETSRFIAQSNEGMSQRLRVALTAGSFGALVGVTTAAGMAAVLYIGARDIQAGTLTLGELLLVMGYLTQLYAPVKTISRKIASLQSHLAGAERAFALLDEIPDVPEHPNPRPLARTTGAVVWRNVSFAYEAGRPVLCNLSFAVAPGTCLGIVGATGEGKTTLVNLLTRFYDPTEGDILLDGVDLRDYRLADLRQQYAIVLQEPVLFSTSIAENIAYARPGAGEAEITAAAKAANAHDFIRRLPRGYDTLAGERGLCLSGGERQRISLARAFLKDAPILLLDEPTSAVDVKTEAAIVEALERLVRGRTTFIIAHRPSVLTLCDRILKIEHGKAALESGDRRTGGGMLVQGVATAAA